MATEPETPFLAAIHKATPNGEWISVQHHPDGDWSVANTPTETPSPDVMEVWREARRAWRSGPAIVRDEETNSVRIGDREAAATVIAEAKARWEREAFEKAAQVADEYEGSARVERSDDPSGAVACEIADLIRALKEPRP